MSLFKNYNKQREQGGYPYSNRHMTAEKPHFGRFCGRHRAVFLGASRCCTLKQFDIHRVKVYRHFRGRTANPYFTPYVQFGVGVISNKFLYKASQKM